MITIWLPQFLASHLDKIAHSGGGHLFLITFLKIFFSWLHLFKSKGTFPRLPPAAFLSYLTGQNFIPHSFLASLQQRALA